MGLSPRTLRPASSLTSFPTAGLLAFWKLADVTDSSGNGNTLTNTDDVAFVAGKIGNAAEFNTANYLSRAMNVNFSQEFSVSLWCKPSDVQIYGCMLFGDAGGTFNVAYTGDSSFDINNGAAGFINVPAAPDLWYHIAVTKGAELTTVWINGALVQQDANQGNSNTAVIYIGQSSGMANNYTGLLDAIGIWTRVLTNAEIASLYNSGNGSEP